MAIDLSSLRPISYKTSDPGGRFYDIVTSHDHDPLMKSLLELTAREASGEVLSNEETSTLAEQVSSWNIEGSLYLTREFSFGSFTEAIRFVGAVADLAEAEGHHPDIDIRYSTVTLRLSTHDSSALTLKDFIVAKKLIHLARLYNKNIFETWE